MNNPLGVEIKKYMLLSYKRLCYKNNTTKNQYLTKKKVCYFVHWLFAVYIEHTFRMDFSQILEGNKEPH